MKFLGLTFRWVLSTLFIVFGPLHFFGGIALVVRAWNSKSWPSVTGTIVSSKVVEHRGKGVSYSPEIKYQYRVGSSSFNSSDIWLLDFAAGEDRAREIVAEFPSGSSTLVFHAPSSPARSVLKPGTNWFMFATIGMGFVVFLVGAIWSPVTEFLWKKRKKPNKAPIPTVTHL